jgi:hypothetical protein
MAAPKIVDIDHPFIGREGEPVGEDHIVEDKRDGAEIGCEAIDAGKREIPLLGNERARSPGTPSRLGGGIYFIRLLAH